MYRKRRSDQTRRPDPEVLKKPHIEIKAEPESEKKPDLDLSEVGCVICFLGQICIVQNTMVVWGGGIMNNSENNSGTECRKRGRGEG